MSSIQPGPKFDSARDVFVTSLSSTTACKCKLGPLAPSIDSFLSGAAVHSGEVILFFFIKEELPPSDFHHWKPTSNQSMARWSSHARTCTRPPQISRSSTCMHVHHMYCTVHASGHVHHTCMHHGDDRGGRRASPCRDRLYLSHPKTSADHLRFFEIVCYVFYSTAFSLLHMM